MYIPSNPSHTFKVPFKSNEIEKALITYVQNGMEIFSKEGELGRDYQISARLSEDETLQFTPDVPIFIQLKIKVSGIIHVSKPSQIIPRACLKMEKFDVET